MALQIKITEGAKRGLIAIAVTLGGALISTQADAAKFDTDKGTVKFEKWDNPTTIAKKIAADYGVEISPKQLAKDNGIVGKKALRSIRVDTEWEVKGLKEAAAAIALEKKAKTEANAASAAKESSTNAASVPSQTVVKEKATMPLSVQERIDYAHADTSQPAFTAPTQIYGSDIGKVKPVDLAQNRIVDKTVPFSSFGITSYILSYPVAGNAFSYAMDKDNVANESVGSIERSGRVDVNKARMQKPMVRHEEAKPKKITGQHQETRADKQDKKRKSEQKLTRSFSSGGANLKYCRVEKKETPKFLGVFGSGEIHRLVPMSDQYKRACGCDSQQYKIKSGLYARGYSSGSDACGKSGGNKRAAIKETSSSPVALASASEHTSRDAPQGGRNRSQDGNSALNPSRIAPASPYGLFAPVMNIA